MRSKSKEMAFVVVGLLLAAVGLVMLRWMPEAWSGPLPYLCLGVGAGAFGWGSGELQEQTLATDRQKNVLRLQKGFRFPRQKTMAIRALWR